MKYARRILVFLLGLLAVGCGSTQQDQIQRIVDSPIEITSNFDQETDFSKYTTWNWIPAPQGDDPRTGDAQTTEDIQQAVAGQMFSRGYRQLESGYDLIANYHLAVEPMTAKMINQMYGGQFPAYMTDIKGTASDEKWDQGTLILFLFDATNGQLVWRAAAEAQVTPNASPKQRQQRINEAVTMMLDKLPMRSK